jgi:ABC-type transporter Mla subunit MlaD
MTDPNIHLKLDRILANQDKILRQIIEHDETIGVLTAAMATLNETIGTQTEVINRLSEAMSQEPEDGDIQDLIKSIAGSLKQIRDNGADMRVMLGRLAPAVAQAAQDAVFMALGDGVPVPPEEDKA